MVNPVDYQRTPKQSRLANFLDRFLDSALHLRQTEQELNVYQQFTLNKVLPASLDTKNLTSTLTEFEKERYELYTTLYQNPLKLKYFRWIVFGITLGMAFGGGGYLYLSPNFDPATSSLDDTLLLYAVFGSILGLSQFFAFQKNFMSPKNNSSPRKKLPKATCCQLKENLKRK